MQCGDHKVQRMLRERPANENSEGVSSLPSRTLSWFTDSREIELFSWTVQPDRDRPFLLAGNQSGYRSLATRLREIQEGGAADTANGKLVIPLAIPRMVPPAVFWDQQRPKFAEAALVSFVELESYVLKNVSSCTGFHWFQQLEIEVVDGTTQPVTARKGMVRVQISWDYVLNAIEDFETATFPQDNSHALAGSHQWPGVWLAADWLGAG